MNETLRQFSVITCDMLPADDRAQVLATLAEFKTGRQAHQHANAKGFALNTIDGQGRVLVLSWKGVEVAMLFRRATQTIEVLPKESIPAIKLSTLDDAWIVVNLLQTTVPEEVTALRARVAFLEVNNSQQDTRVRQLDEMHEKISLVVDELMTDRAALRDKLKNFTEPKKSLVVREPKPGLKLNPKYVERKTDDVIEKPLSKKNVKILDAALKPKKKLPSHLDWKTRTTNLKPKKNKEKKEASKKFYAAQKAKATIVVKAKKKKLSNDIFAPVKKKGEAMTEHLSINVTALLKFNWWSIKKHSQKKKPVFSCAIQDLKETSKFYSGTDADVDEAIRIALEEAAKG